MYISFYITDSRNGLVFQYLPSTEAPSFTNLWTRIESTCPQLTQLPSNGSFHDDIEGNKNVNILDSTATFTNNESLTHGLVSKDLEVFKYYSKVNNIYYWCLKSLNPDPVTKRGLDIEPHIIMEEIDRMLLDYFDKDEISVKKIMNNYDQITLIFNCCINGGEPMTGGMYMNRVKNIVPMKSDLSKVINSTAHTIQNVVARRQYPLNGFVESNGDGKFRTHNNQLNRFKTGVEIVPWRNNNNNHSYAIGSKTTTATNMSNRNEFYLDIRETMCLVMERTMNKRRKDRGSRQFQLVNGKITGIFDCRSYLIGDAPFVSIDLDNNGYDLGFPSLHPCVEIDQFDSQNTKLSFIPPNGKFRLMEYSLDINKERSWDTTRGKTYKFSNQQFGIVSVDYLNNLGIKEDEFEITVNIASSRKVLEIYDLSIELQFKVNGKSNEINMFEDDYPKKIRILRSTHGRFTQLVNQNKGYWEFDSKISTGTTAILRGCIEDQNNDRNERNEEEESYNSNNTNMNIEKDRSKYILNRVILRYRHEGQSLSGIKVNGIKVENQISSNNSTNSNKIQPAFKGVKYISYVKDIEMRTI